MIRVEVCNEVYIDAAESNLLLPETDRNSPPHIEDEPLTAHFNQRAVSEAVWRGYRAACAKEGNCKIISRQCQGRKKKGKTEESPYSETSDSTGRNFTQVTGLHHLMYLPFE
jgi:hypothetical protein